MSRAPARPRSLIWAYLLALTLYTLLLFLLAHASAAGMSPYSTPAPYLASWDCGDIGPSEQPVSLCAVNGLGSTKPTALRVVYVLPGGRAGQYRPAFQYAAGPAQALFSLAPITKAVKGIRAGSVTVYATFLFPGGEKRTYKNTLWASKF